MPDGDNRRGNETPSSRFPSYLVSVYWHIIYAIYQHCNCMVVRGLFKPGYISSWFINILFHYRPSYMSAPCIREPKNTLESNPRN